MLDLTARIQAGHELTEEEIRAAVAHLVAPEAAEDAKAAFLKSLRERGETGAEIAGFARALLEHAVPTGIDASALPGPIIDVCGTGGDRMELFNVSTTSMFVIAAGGGVVVKHGNRAITSRCGGADVLEELGVAIDLPPERLRRTVETLGLGFVFAQAYHPAFKVIAPVRKRLAAEGVPTIFNMLGPLLNPARPSHQLVGIFSAAHLPKYAEALAQLGRTRAWAVHGDGLDELSTAGINSVYEVNAGTIRTFTLDAAAHGLARTETDLLRGGDRVRNAEITRGILTGEWRGPMQEIVLLNAAAAFIILGLDADLESALARAREQIESGRAAARLDALRAATS